MRPILKTEADRIRPRKLPTGPSERFLRLGRNPDMPSPRRVERTVKQPGDIEI